MHQLDNLCYPSNSTKESGATTIILFKSGLWCFYRWTRKFGNSTTKPTVRSRICARLRNLVIFGRFQNSLCQKIRNFQNCLAGPPFELVLFFGRKLFWKRLKMTKFRSRANICERTVRTSCQSVFRRVQLVRISNEFSNQRLVRFEHRDFHAHSTLLPLRSRSRRRP